jgi:hypothetical protein
LGICGGWICALHLTVDVLDAPTEAAFRSSDQIVNGTMAVREELVPTALLTHRRGSTGGRWLRPDAIGPGAIGGDAAGAF